MKRTQQYTWNHSFLILLLHLPSLVSPLLVLWGWGSGGCLSWQPTDLTDLLLSPHPVFSEDVGTDGNILFVASKNVRRREFCRQREMLCVSQIFCKKLKLVLSLEKRKIKEIKFYCSRKFLYLMVNHGYLWDNLTSNFEKYLKNSILLILTSRNKFWRKNCY